MNSNQIGMKNQCLGKDLESKWIFQKSSKLIFNLFWLPSSEDSELFISDLFFILLYTYRLSFLIGFFLLLFFFYSLLLFSLFSMFELEESNNE